MLFAHDTEVALVTAAALVNTEQQDGDLLANVEALDEFVRHWGYSGQRRHDQAELESVAALRSRLRPLWSTDEDAAVDLVNELLREARALPQLVKHDEWEYHLHATEDDSPLADRMAVETAMAVADAIRQRELDRLHACAAEACSDVLVDLSKNRSRRFCSVSCANRTNVAAYRSRRTGAQLSTDADRVPGPSIETRPARG